MPKRIAILGSTGSIGRNTLEVIEHLGGDFRAVALSGHRQLSQLLEQARKHRPAAVAIAERTGDISLIEEIRRNIQAAGQEPVERNGRFDPVRS